MNIELKFLQKAIKDKNYISFMYENKKYESIKPLKLVNEDNKYILISHEKSFEFTKVSKFQVLKNRFK